MNIFHHWNRKPILYFFIQILIAKFASNTCKYLIQSIFSSLFPFYCDLKAFVWITNQMYLNTAKFPCIRCKITSLKRLLFFFLPNESKRHPLPWKHISIIMWKVCSFSFLFRWGVGANDDHCPLPDRGLFNKSSMI